MRESEKMNLSGTEIAVVGMAARLPGARNIDEYWRNLCGGVEAIRRFTDDELKAAGVAPSILSDPHYVKAGGVLEDMEGFDSGFFGFSPKDAAILDPQHRHFYECAWAALEHAGHTSRRFDGSIGVFAGCGMNAYFIYNILGNPGLLKSVGLFLLRHTGNDRDFLPTSVSYKMNLRGPSVAIQTACSTSLVAIHMACQSLLGLECDMAISGGVTIIIPHRQGYHYAPNEVQSPDGHCRPFDARGAGTVLTSGVGVVVLRRLVDAIDDGDFIHAVIRGSAVNNDGSGKVGYLAPSVDGHARVVTEALGVAGVEPESVSYLEAHGTGTLVGDPIEIAALTQAYGQRMQKKGFCRIGSAKANIGHLDTAAGVAGVIKVVEALKHRQIPPSINFETPNPAINFATGPFVVNTALTEWAGNGGPRRAGISSLGVGGTNVHTILEEAPALGPTDPARPCEVLVVSARTPGALDAATANLAEHLRSCPGLNLGDVAHTLQIGREWFEHRRTVACDSLEDAATALSEKDAKRVFTGRAPKSEPSVVFMFPGGGAQYPGMGRGVYEHQAVYRQEVDRCLEILRALVDFDLRGLMFPAPGREPEAGGLLEKACASVCAVFTVEYALARLWMSWGIQPAAMTGHSLGEYTAACLAGVMSLTDALRVVALRGRLVQSVPDAAMLSVPLSEEQTSGLLGDDLDLAAVNGPELCVVAGRPERLTRLEQELLAKDVECKRLRLAGASHSRFVEPILAEFRSGIASIRLNPPQLRYLSNVTGTWVRPEDAQSPDYWVRHFRGTVRFSQGAAELLNQQGRLLMEVGPGQTLSSLARQQPVKPVAVLSSLRHPEDATPDLRFLMSNFGRLWVAGVGVDFAKLHEGKRRRRVPLPTYPFEHQRYWIDPVKTVAVEGSAERRLQRLAGVDEWFSRPVWKQEALVHEPVAAANGQRHTTLVFLDTAGVGAELVSSLVRRGDKVVTVRDGDAFYKLRDGEYALAPEAGREGYDQLFADLTADKRLPTRIVHMWMITAEEKFRPGSSFFHRNLERGFYSLLFMMQALGGQDLPAGLRIAVASNGMQSLDGERLAYPEKAALLGPVRVIPREFPGVATQSVDVDLPHTAVGQTAGKANRSRVAQAAEQVMQELDARAPALVVAYRAGSRWRQDLERVKLAAPTGMPSCVRERGVYVVTGGLGGIGLAAAEHLARTARARLVLVGRSGLPQRSEWDGWLGTHNERDRTSRKIRRLRAIEELGGEVLVGAADVANIEAMQAVLSEARRRFGEINGVVHAAGTVEDGLIHGKTQEAVERIFTPKIHGTLLLADLLKGAPLDFFVLFSSTSSFMGAAGQVDYVAANAFLDAFARSRLAPQSGVTIAVNWGVWKHIGMATAISHRLKGQEADEPSEHVATAHPLLDERIIDTADQIVFASRYRTGDRWVLGEHRTRAGQALLPGTAYIEIARAAIADVTEAERAEIRDLSFVAPLAVGEDETREVRVSLNRDADRYAFEVTSRSFVNGVGGGEWDLHAQGSVKASEPIAPTGPVEQNGRLMLDEIVARCPRQLGRSGGPALQTPQGEHLAFGPRWRTLRRINFGEGEAIAELELPVEFRPDLKDFKLHPAVLDLATGFYLPLIEGYDGATQLYVPLTYRRIRVHAPLTARVFSHVRGDAKNQASRDVATFDATITDEEGNTLVEVEQFSMRKLADAAAFAKTASRERAAPASADTAGGTAAANLSAGERLFLEAYEAGITSVEGMAVLDRVLGAESPGPQVAVSPVDLPVLIERTGEAAVAADKSGVVKFSRPDLQSKYEGPRDEIERTLAGFWEDLLGVQQVGIHDDFFELGGHSLIAVRLFARIKKAYSVEYPLSTLFEAPTIARCAELLRRERGETMDTSGAAPITRQQRHRFLVPMNTTPEATRAPFFVVAGMFGNVLNLRHMAAHLGQDQPVYALQARGLHGDDKPHETFEEMATDYLQEVRLTQPKGPYFLGGFSGGGITALEMAHQLLEAGEEVAMLIMLDSLPPKMPTLTPRERLQIQWERLRRRGIEYVRDYAMDKWRWEKKRLGRHFRKEAPDLTPAEFRSEEIKDAFYRALGRYMPPVYPGKMILFRPVHEEAHLLGLGRMVNSHREFMDDANFWRPYFAGGVEVHVMSGDHDHMVLEPHVRVLAAKLRACIDDAQVRRPGPGAPVKEAQTAYAGAAG